MLRVTVILLLCSTLVVAILPAQTNLRYKQNLPRFQRIRFLQQRAPPPPPSRPTGYPAAGEQPDVPFDLPTTSARPQTSYLPPSSTPGYSYGPPPSPKPQSTYGSPENEPQLPENSYGPPEAAPEVLVTRTEDGTVIAVSTSFGQGVKDTAPAIEENEPPQAAQLVFQRFPQRGWQERLPEDVPVPARFTEFQQQSLDPRYERVQFRQPQSFARSERFQTFREH